MYRVKDEEEIIRNLDRLEEEAMRIKLDKYEPTRQEIDRVYNEIYNFIRKNNRIVYGGYAQNSLIKVKNKEDVFYKDTDIADIEFYSPDPIGDMMDICDILKSKNYKYVEGKEGVHNETYKIFVNFINYCDISYLAPNIFNNCPSIKVNDMHMTHPHFMLIDAYRVYNDPMTSYFRLKKTFVRFNKLIKYYPFNENMIYNKFEFTTKMDKKNIDSILKFIRKNIIHNNKLIVIGHYAFNQLMKLSNAPTTYTIDTTFYQLISTNYEKDINNITNILIRRYKNIKTKKYNPFSQFLGKSTEFYINDDLVLRVYDNNDRCTVYRYSDKKKTYFGTYQLIFMYILIQYILGIIRKNKFIEMMYGSMIMRLIKARDKYLEENGKTVLDKTIFQEFTFECIGEPVDILRQSFLNAAKKREQGKKMKFSYTPTGTPGKKPNYKFDNTSGELR